jgi:hypothetical protein
MKLHFVSRKGCLNMKYSFDSAYRVKIEKNVSLVYCQPKTKKRVQILLLYQKDQLLM